jgi:serine/threonine-protein kinase ATR
MLLNQADGMMANSPNPHPRILEFAIEASWVSGKWDVLDKYLMRSEGSIESSYEIKIGSALSALRKQDTDTFAKEIARARENVVSRLSESLTGSLRQCHDSMVKLHSLSEIEEISLTLQQGTFDKASFSANLERRLDVMGTYSNHKQYILALRRAVFQLSGYKTLSLKCIWTKLIAVVPN